MGSDALDDLDMGILHLLGEDARNVTTEALADRLGVASSTVANRIRSLEEEGIITGYAPFVDYEGAGFDRQLEVIGTIPQEADDSVIDDVVGVRGVVAVRKLVTDEENLSITLLAESQDDVERTLGRLRELEVEIANTEVVEFELRNPVGGFGADAISDGEN